MYKKIFLLFLVIVGCFLYFQNNHIGITTIEIVNKKIPRSFDGYKIVQISDLHNKLFGKNQEKLVEKIKTSKPDIIVVTGDLIDSREYNEDVALMLMKRITSIAPVYYVTGNHERGSGTFSGLEDKLNEMEVIVLRNTKRSIVKDGEEISIIGIDDPNFGERNLIEGETITDQVTKQVKKVSREEKSEVFKILLAHRPEYFSVYSSCEMDLIFSGHAHGGQIRLPFIPGFYAPGQGFFPKYTSGKYEQLESIMVVSRGLGNSASPQRIFNTPEIVTVTLKSM